MCVCVCVGRGRTRDTYRAGFGPSSKNITDFKKKKLHLFSSHGIDVLKLPKAKSTAQPLGIADQNTMLQKAKYPWGLKNAFWGRLDC